MRSRASYQSQEDTARATLDAAGLIHALRHLAELDRLNGDALSALDRASEAVRLCREGCDPLELANALRQRALALEALSGTAAGDWREAEALYQQLGVEEGAAECRAALQASG